MRKKLLSVIVLIAFVLNLLQVSVFAAPIWEGEGTEASPYLISTGEQLRAIPSGTTSHFKIVNDIDLGSRDWNTINLFSGILDGSMYKIKNLSIVSSANMGGIFKLVSNGATIKNLVIDNPNVTIYEGGILAYEISDSQLINSHIVGGKLNLSYYGGSFCRTLKGGTIKQCSSTTEIKNGSETGGLIHALYTGSIEDSFYKGTIESLNMYVGGIVSHNYTKIQNIINSYAVAKYTGKKPSKEGLYTMYMYTDTKLTSSYFDKEVAGIVSTSDNARTTNEMFKKATYVGWDFENIWGIDEGKGYPYLRSMVNTPEEPTANLSILLAVGEEAQLIITDSITDNVNYTWSSSFADIASVDANGLVTALKEGKTMITAENTETGFKEYISVKVMGGNVDDNRLAVNLLIGKSIRLYVSDSENIVYTSMDPTIATVTTDGKVQAISKGLVLIKAEYDGVVETIYIRVS